MRSGPDSTLIGGRYRVVGELGEGGMGRVLLAEHADLQTHVAVKLLSEVSEKSRARFLREARAVARLKSEHVARVLDLGTEADPYIVMEFVHGVDLASLVETSPLPVERAVDYALQACAGLAEAHRIGIVHRDVKPSNLRVTKRPDGTDLVKLLDFGIAKSEVTGVETLTRTTDVLGSPRYMSPEQIREAHGVDARSDVWSLGVVLYHLLTMRHPFEAFTTSGLLARIAADPPAAPREHREELSPALEAVLLRCLEKKPADRYPDVGELALALAPFGGEDAKATASSVAAILRTEPAPRVLLDRVTPPSIPRPSRAELVQASPLRNPAPSSRVRVAGVAIGAMITVLLVIGWRASRADSTSMLDQSASASPSARAEPPPMPPRPDTAPPVASAPTGSLATTMVSTSPPPAAHPTPKTVAARPTSSQRAPSPTSDPYDLGPRR